MPAARQGAEHDLRLGGDFFAAAGHADLLGGDILAHVSLVPAGGEWRITLRVEGQVRTRCDRCQAPMDVRVDDEYDAPLLPSPGGLVPPGDDTDAVYYDPATGQYGALGHGITDVDTAQLMPLGSGAIMETTVKAVKKGAKGDPGELKGDFSVQRDVGTVTVNSSGGIFGTVADPDFLSGGTPVPVAAAGQITTGPATILATVSGSDVREYRVELVRLYGADEPTRNLLLRITDPALLSATGGIVQGMSGSPILQNGRLVGAVTHVLVNDPTRGYGIFAQTMLEQAERVTE